MNLMGILGWMAKQKAKEKQVYVRGSGLVPVPPGRLNEISKVVQEAHELEAARAKLMAAAKRVVV